MYETVNVLMMATSAFWPLIVVPVLITITPIYGQSFEIDPYEVRNLALRFGKDIYEGSLESTCARKVKDNFNDMKARVVWFDDNKMMEDMRTDVLNMLTWKRHAVERIANESERLAANHTYDKNMDSDYINMKKIYDDSKGPPPSRDDDDGGEEMRPVRLSPHINFEGSNVNLDLSAVHMPINVYEKASDIVNDIKWSENLTPFFKNNLAFDPGLSWQFFGSSKGFLRLYPATEWKTETNLETDEPPPDLYDCRMRPWYIQAAASAKDVVILLDSSGSMTGLRNTIAKNVVSTILDTLTDDDYVSVLNFSEKVSYVDKCFDNLVQANEKNVRILKEAVDRVKPSEVANFTLALMKAFELLQTLNKAKQGAQCNQAIMLITDGAPDNFEDVFRQYNWPNIPVRVFTYLIGREVTESKEVYWMACRNRGYYTHVANLAEVREQVQQYIPVMSRPIVLSGARTFAWTPVYAHVSEVPLTDWVWEEREKAYKTKYLQQRKPVSDSQVNEQSEHHQQTEDHNILANGLESAPTVTDRLISTESENPKKIQKFKNLQLMTTLATPVFDTRNYTNITRRILVKNVYQDSEPETIRIANLLGVAGVDVPIKEIVKLTPAFKLGVNGYSFVTTNNGYLLYHPDLRPMVSDQCELLCDYSFLKFQNMLKPYYSSVDMSEVELADNNMGPREMDDSIKEIRDNMINRNVGWKKVKVKIHMDNMKRVVTRTNNFIYGKIDFTPFSLAIVLPEPYGSYRVEGQIEVKVRREENFTHYFRGNNWRVHPDWVYCDSPHKMSGISPESREEYITTFLKNVINGQHFRWKTSSTRPQVYETISCDKYLVQSLVFDAKATDIEASKCGTSTFSTAKIEDQKIEMFGIVATFVATRSGLTRFEDHRSEEEKMNGTNEPTFILNNHTKATEELYYRRAVDFHFINDSAFVFSVPFERKLCDVCDANKPSGPLLVTASHAIFLGSGKSSAPVAVVGLQFKHSVFVEHFINISNKYSKGFCSAEEVDCYLLDNNGFIIYSEMVSQTGKFFGEIDNSLLQAMVTAKVYRKVRLYDYQAICLDIIATQSRSSILLTPFIHLKSVVLWFWSRILTLYINLWYDSWFSFVNADYDNEDYSDGDDYSDEPDNDRKNNRTRPYPCDKEFDLYEMDESLSEEPIKGDHKCNEVCLRGFIVQAVPHTNLVLLVVHKTCACESSQTKSIEPKEVNYGVNQTCDLLKAEMPRKRPTTCHHYHPQEKEIKQCGRSSKSVISLLLLIVSTILSFVENT